MSVLQHKYYYMLQYNVYVGQTKDETEAREIQKKINQAGYCARIYNMGLYWSLKIAQCNHYFDAYRWVDELKKKGFDAFILNIGENNGYYR